MVSGRARVTIEQLFALIHDVNPTDKGLSARQQAEGYAVKSRLQSYLIRQHADLLVVERHPSDERVVSIQHRVAGRDACHAVAPSLDDDARRWVETELGLAERRAKAAGNTDAPARAERKAPTAGPGDPLSAGRAALESYEYDEARRLFSQVLDRSPGNLSAAEALLDLLVNHLADDQAAVVLGERLVAPASTDPAVLGCLALAAARHGDVSLARRWLKGADPTGAVEAWVLLGEHAARIGSLDDTRACVIAIHEMEPGHRALPRLRDAVTRMQADERAPAEAALSAAMLAEDWLEVEHLARDILARWPMSEPARTAQRELARLHKERDSRELVGRAWQAWHRGDTASLLSAIAQARALGVADVDTVAWMDEAEGAAQEQIESTRFARAREALAEGALVVGLTEWLALKPGPQAELRAAFGRPEFGWLDAVPVGEGRVQAVVALGQAQDAFLEDDVERAARLLEPHIRVLRAVPDARGLLNDIARTRGELDERASIVAQRRIADARAAGDFDAALALSAGLAPETRRRVRAEIEAERANTARLRLTEDAIAAGDILRARELARKRGDVAVVAELTARLRSEWKISVWADIDPGVIDVTLPPDPVCPLPWLVDDGAAFVYVQVLAGWVFARVIVLETMAVRRVVSFRAPEAMRVHYVHVEDDVVTVVDQWGALVAFHLTDGDIVRWLARPPGTRDVDTLSEGAVLAPGGRYLWMPFHAVGSRALRVYDTESWPSFRTVEHAYPVPLLGCSEPRMARVGIGQGATIHAPNGNSSGRKVFFGDALVTRACVHPAGFPICVLADGSKYRDPRVAALNPTAREALPADPVAFSSINPDRINASRATYPTARLSQPHQIAVATGEGAVYVKMGPGGASQIITYREQPDGLVSATGNPTWAPATALLLTDSRGFRVRAVALGQFNLREVPLDDRLPENEMTEAHRENYMSAWPDGGLDFDLGCKYSASTLTETGKSLLRALKAMPVAAREQWIANFKLAEDNATSLFDLASVLGALDRREEAERLFEETGTRFPDHSRWRLIRANAEAQRGLWADVLGRLDGVDVAGLDGTAAQHLLHLRGIARLRSGAAAGGAADIRRASTFTGACAIHVPLRLLDILDGAAIPAEVEGTDSYILSRFGPVVHAIIEADRCLAAGDPEQAITVLDIVLVWRSRDRQSLARLAQAWLDVHPEEPVRQLRRRLALATFLGVHDDYEDGFGHDLPIPPHSWGKERIAELVGRVRGELEGRG